MKTHSTKVAAACLVAALAGGLAAAPASAQSFYGVTYGPLTGVGSQFLSVSGTTGQADQTGTLAAPVAASGLAAYNGSLYTFDTSTNSLLKLNAATGATLASFSVGISGSVAPGGLAISSSGLAFLASPLTSSSQSMPASTIYAFSLTGGSAFTIGTTSDLLSGLAFDSNDTLYGLGKGDGNLYTINTASGKGSLVGNLGNISVPDPFGPGGFSTYAIDSGPIGALAFSGGTLYAAADDTLYRVSTTTGAATAVDPSLFNTGLGSGFSSVSGLAAVPAAVPEASSIVSFGVLLALGGVFLIRRRARQS